MPLSSSLLFEGLFLSPKATIALPSAAVLIIEALLFLGTGLGLFLVGHGTAAIIGCVVWALDRIAIALLSKRDALRFRTPTSSANYREVSALPPGALHGVGNFPRPFWRS